MNMKQRIAYPANRNQNNLYFVSIKQRIAYLVLLLTATSSLSANTTLAPECFESFECLECLPWNGLYAGWFVGGSTGAHITTTEPIRLDNGAYWFRQYNDNFSFKTKSSFLGGFTLGYNFQNCALPLMLGLEGEYGYIRLKARSEDPNQIPYSSLPNSGLKNVSQNSVQIGKRGYTLLGVRVGYPIADCLFYVKSGPVFTRIQSTYSSVKTEDDELVYLNLFRSKSFIGYGVGGGFEFFLPFDYFSNFSAKIEYLFLGINRKQDVYGHCSCNFLWRTIEQIRGVNTLKIGINYNYN